MLPNPSSSLVVNWVESAICGTSLEWGKRSMLLFQGLAIVAFSVTATRESPAHLAGLTTARGAGFAPRGVLATLKAHALPLELC